MIRTGGQKLTPHEALQLRAAQDRGYLVDRSRRRVCLANRWWELCEQQQRPYMRINATRRQASVVVDLLPAGGRFSEAALKQIRELFLRYQGQRSICFLGENSVSFHRIPAASVEELVGELQRRVRPLNNVYDIGQRGRGGHG